MANIRITEDTFISIGSPNANYASSTTIGVNGAISSGWERGLIKLPPFPCRMWLYCTQKMNDTLYIYKITAPWDTSTVTWNTAPSYDSTPIATAPIVANQWIEVDILYVLPYGILLGSLPANAYGASFFASNENSSNQPYVTSIADLSADLSFVDAVSGVLFVSDKSNLGEQLDFTQIVAGNVSNIRAIDLYNYNGYSVLNPIVYLENLPSEDTIEISKFNNPFIPSPEVLFDGTFVSGAKIGTFYVRIKPSEDSSGSKSFRIKASAIPV